MNVFDLVATLRLDSSEYNEELGSSKSALSSFGSAAASGLASAAKATVAATTAVTGAMVAGTAQTASYGDSIDKMSQKVGLSAEAYQKWDYVMKISGTEMSSMTVGLKTLTNKLDDAKNGSDDAQAMFAKLGLSMEDLGTMSREDVFASVIEGFQGMEESTERAALANDLFGRSGQELAPLFNTSVEATHALIDEVESLGGVMSDDAVKASAAYQDQLTAMQTSFSGLKNNLMSSFLPSMTTVMSGITGIMSGDKGAISEVTKGIRSFITNIQEVIPRFTEAGGEIIGTIVGAISENLPSLAESAIELITTLFNGIVEQLPMIADSATQIITTIITTIAENLPQIIESGIELIVTLSNGLADQIPTLVPVILNAVITIVNTLIQNAPKLLQAALTLIQALAKGLIDYLPQLIAQLPTIISSIVSSLMGMSGQILSTGVDLLLELGKGLIKAIPQLVLNLPKIIASMVEGLLKGIGDFADVGLRLVEGLWEGISDAADWVVGKIKGFGEKILGGIKSFFGIHSPSTVFAEIGDYMAQGLAEGWDDSVGDVIDQMNDDMDLEGNATMNLSAGNIDDLNKNVTIGESFVGQLNSVIDAQIERLINVITGRNLSIVLDTGILVGEIAQDMDIQLGIEAGRNAR